MAVMLSAAKCNRHRMPVYAELGLSTGLTYYKIELQYQRKVIAVTKNNAGKQYNWTVLCFQKFTFHICGLHMVVWQKKSLLCNTQILTSSLFPLSMVKNKQVKKYFSNLSMTLLDRFIEVGKFLSLDFERYFQLEVSFWDQIFIEGNGFNNLIFLENFAFEVFSMLG